MTLRTWLHMVDQAFQALIMPVDRSRFYTRLRICHRCPLFDRGLKRCRPFTGSDLGCGCYVPFKAKCPDPCWARQNQVPDLGWD